MGTSLFQSDASSLWVYISVLATAAAVVYCYSELKRVRSEFPGAIELPRSFLFGHIISCGSLIATDRHPDYGFQKIWEKLERPALFYMDMRPLAPSTEFICADPTIAEQITQSSPAFQQSLPKGHISRNGLKSIFGEESIMIRGGEEWRDLRKVYSPGFQPKHIDSLVPLVYEHMETFLCRVTKEAHATQPVRLTDFAREVSLDIVAHAVLGENLHVQSSKNGEGEKGSSGLIRLLHGLADNYPVSVTGKPQFIQKVYSYYYCRLFDRRIEKIIKSKLDLEAKQDPTGVPSILSLAAIHKPLNPSTLRSISHQTRTMLFGGEDPTSVMLQWLFYELALQPCVLQKMQEEHLSILGVDAKASILSPEGKVLLSKLAYTTAVIKEVLRLHPPATTERSIPPRSQFNVTFPDPRSGMDKTMCLDGGSVVVSHWIIGRNPKVWGEDADRFRPERFLDDAYMASLPAGAWRPFERGPRACIGKQLALVEGKIALVLLGQKAREGLRWEKLGYRGKEIDGMEEVFDICMLARQPVDGMRMRFWMEHHQQ